MVKNELSKGIDIELGEEMAEGQYANMVVIAHSTSEFVLDFVRIMPGLPKARVKSRIVLAPEHAKRLLLSLHENIARYENSIGPIPIPSSSADEKKSHELPGRRGLTRRTVPERRKRTAAIRRRLRRPSRKKAMFRPRAVAKRLPGGLSSVAEIRRHINGTVST